MQNIYKNPYMTTQELINIDINSLKLHLKNCQKKINLKDYALHLIKIIKDNCIRKTFTTVILTSGIIKLGFVVLG